MIDRDFCLRFGILVQSECAQPATVYLTEASDLSVIPAVRHIIGTPLRFEWIDRGLLEDRVRQVYDTDRNRPTDSRVSSPPTAGEGTGANGRIVQSINQMIVEGLRSRASDLHIEPHGSSLVCRCRVDGVLMKQRVIPISDASETLSRIKIMAGLDIAEKRRPQDGRIRFELENRVVDIRVSIIPTESGEKAVLRLLDKASLRLDLNAIGFDAIQERLFTERIESPNGIVIVTGPTGSGKTTTLYAALTHLQNGEFNISTVEDPIEYNLDGINQTQVKPGIGLTFAAMLRALLRQDPDIIMIGEVRDAETLEMAFRASLTGHLVLTTLHTNDALSSITRLFNLGADAYVLASCLRLVVAQRLVRCMCPNCKVLDESQEARGAADRLGAVAGLLVYRGVGCPKCHQTGFMGRRAIFELLDVSERVRAGIGRGLTEGEVAQIARSDGHCSLRDAAAQLLSEGVTTPIELLREISA